MIKKNRIKQKTKQNKTKQKIKNEAEKNIEFDLFENGKWKTSEFKLENVRL